MYKVILNIYVKYLVFKVFYIGHFFLLSNHCSMSSISCQYWLEMCRGIGSCTRFFRKSRRFLYLNNLLPLFLWGGMYVSCCCFLACCLSRYWRFTIFCGPSDGITEVCVLQKKLSIKVAGSVRLSWIKADQEIGKIKLNQKSGYETKLTEWM